MFSSHHIKRMWTELVIEGGVYKTEVVIETDIETRTDAPGFDANKFSALVEAAVAANANGSHERVRVIPVGVRDADRT